MTIEPGRGLRDVREPRQRAAGSLVTLVVPSWADTWGEVATRVERPAADHAVDPNAFIEERLGETVWSTQRVILDSIRDHRYTAVKSCHQAGKSRIASRAVAWWAETKPVGQSLVITTAPTAAQVAGVLWREVNGAHIAGGLKGRINRAGYPQWFAGSNDSELIGFGRKPGDYSEAAFQGYHAPHILVVIDEACGVKAGLWAQIDSLIGNVSGRVLAIGNPDDPTSQFAQNCKPDSNWHVIRIDALDTPNFTRWAVAKPCDAPGCKGHPLTRALMEHDGVPYSRERVTQVIRDNLVSPHWVEERLRDWAGCTRDRARQSFEEGGWLALGAYVSEQARGSALITAKVRGMFPEQSTTSVIPLAWAEAARERGRTWTWAQTQTSSAFAGLGRAPVGRLVVGVDVARGGEDKTILAPRIGDWSAPLQEYTYADLVPTSAEVRREVGQRPQGMAVVDDSGVGGGVVDILRRQGVTVVSFVGSAQSHRRTATGDYGFKNDRSAAWWRLRELLNPARDSPLMLPDDDLLIADLTSPRFSIGHGGIIQVEPKDDVKKRLGRSPDRGDAVVMSHWIDGAAPAHADSDATADALPWGGVDSRDPDVVPYAPSDLWS